MAKLRRAIKPDEWEHHMEVLEILSAPKVPPKPRPVRKIVKIVQRIESRASLEGEGNR